MKIAVNSVATFSYILKDSTGVELERSNPEEPMAYLHGHHGIMFALEQALEGGEVGEKIDVELTAAQAYGPRLEDSIKRVPIKHLASKPKKLVVGAIVKVNTRDGAKDATVIKVGKFNVDLDINHPLAGQALNFSIAIHDVREATAEEIAHGHAHGIGGHQH
tara:strand:+ start:5764 stop:6249 length:486 start_codon:yes stop_codon:yes gene_type:complete